jgi:peptide/nickel transport system permease protein
MLRYILQRLALGVLVAVTVSVITFSLLHLSGDLATALAGEGASAEQIESIRTSMGLDRSLPIQYLEWLKGALSGDLGMSFFYRQPVTDMILEKLQVTLVLGACAMSLALLLAIPMGIAASIKPGSLVDRFCLAVAVTAQAMPAFWFALILIVVFGVQLRWFPISGTGEWRHFVLPSIALASYAMPAIMWLTRNGMLEVLSADYIRTARAKGLKRPAILFRHALRNAMIPVVSLAAVQFGFMLGGSIIVESIFALQGVGYLAWESIAKGDFPVVQAVVLLVSLFYVLLTILADVLNAYLDPRIRLS